jgi:hypothetical protein
MQRQIKKLNRPSLADWRNTAEGIQPAFCRLLSSLAVKDGSVIPGAVPILLEAVEEMARADENGHVSANLALHSVTQPIPLSDAINTIKIATKGAGATEREALLRIVLPLVAARGSDARDTAKKISSALNVKLSEIDLLALPDLKVDGQTFLGGLTDRAKGLVGLNSERDAVIDLALSYGEDDIATKVHGAWGGENRSGAMRDAVISLTRHMQSDISAYHEMAVLAQKTQDLASSLVDAAETAFDQINQRLAIIERRMDLLRNDLEEDIERLIDDTGNELKTTMQERFRTDDWTKREAWENFARTQAGKQIELRLNNLRQRYHEHIDVLRDELRVFQNELRITKTKLIPKVSSREIAGIMRGTSLATRMLNKTDEVARVSLWSSVVGGVGLGGVTWGLTAAHVVAFSALAPILAPAAIGLGAVFGASALYKLATDSEGRKQREISEKASQFEGFIEERMRGVLGEQSKQLNELLASFYSSASTILEPIMISAEAAKDMTSLRQSLSDHLIRQTENKIKMLGRMVGG